MAVWKKEPKPKVDDSVWTHQPSLETEEPPAKLPSPVSDRPEEVAYLVRQRKPISDTPQEVAYLTALRKAQTRVGISDLPQEVVAVPQIGAYHEAVREYETVMATLRRNNIQLADDKWMPKYGQRGAGGELMTTGFYDLAKKYQDIGLQQGFRAMEKALEADRVRQVQAITTMEKYKTEQGYDLLTAIRSESPDTMSLAGFDAKDIKRARNALKASKATRVALPGEKSWYNTKTGEVISHDVYLQLTKSAPKKADDYVRATPEVRRMAIQGISTLFFSPTRRALPEVTKEDIKPTEYAVGAAQLALWAIPFAPKGAAIPLMMGSGGVLGYNYAKNYKDLGTGQKVLGAAALALIALPVMATGVKTLIPVAVKVPLASGQVATVWKGISVSGKPIVGISEGKLAVGAKGITWPTLAAIEKGYIPVTKLETSLVATKRALTQMGATDADIARVEATLQVRNYFAGQKSPYLSEQAILYGSERVTPEEMSVILQQVLKNSKKIESIYGSATIPPQLRKELLSIWRKWHDVDIQTTMTAEELAAFTKQVATALEKTGSKVKIDPTNPGSIMKQVKGKWEKITDLHSKDKIPGSPDTLEGAYGMLHAEPVVKIKLPDMGEFQIMRLSETGKRKIASVLQFQKGEIAPPAHRTNDLADLYIIIRNFKGQKLADKWAKAWGTTPEELLKIAKTSPPSQLLGWKIIPFTRGVGSPTVSITPPASMMARLSPTLRASLSASLGSYSSLASPAVALSQPVMSVRPAVSRAVSPTAISQILTASAPALSARARSEISQSISKSISPLVSRGASPNSISLAVSKALSPYVSKGMISPSMSASMSTSVSTSSSLSPSVSPSPSPSPTPSPSPSPSPSPAPSPSPSPSPAPLPVPRTAPSDSAKREYIKSHGVKTVQNMGKLKIGGELRDIWHVWTMDGKHVVVTGLPPEGAMDVDGKGSAYATTRVLGGRTFNPIEHIHGAVRTTIRPAPIPKGARATFTPTQNNTPPLKSIKKGRIFYTQAGNATLMSRRPLGRRNGQRK